MLNLLKSDLYRITRPRGLRGALWQYAGAVAAIFALVYMLFWFITSGDFSAPDFYLMKGYETPSAMLGAVTAGLVPLFASFLVVEHVLADLKDHFARTLVSARVGRLSYFAEKIVFAGVMSALAAFVLAILSLVLFWALGRTFTGSDGALEFLTWALAFWLNTWALAALAMTVTLIIRIPALSYVIAFCLVSGVVAQFFVLASSFINAFGTPALGGVATGIANVIGELTYWMPSMLIAELITPGASALASAGLGEFAQMLPGGAATQAIVAPIIWIAIALAITLAASRRREV